MPSSSQRRATQLTITMPAVSARALPDMVEFVSRPVVQ